MQRESELELLNDRYKVLEVIESTEGRALLRATELSTRRHCLVTYTFVPNHLKADFDGEIRRLRMIQHSKVARVVDAFYVEGEHHYLVTRMPHDAQLLSSLGALALPERQILTAFSDLLSAVKACHDRGIIHRDIWPGTVLISDDGHAMLTGFGLIKAPHESGSGTLQFKRGQGTLNFMPPEQFSRGTDTRSDIYALGATLYFMVTGSNPPSALDRASARAQLPSIRTKRPEFSGHIDSLIERAMATMVGERFASVAELIRAASTSSAQSRGERTATAVPSRAWLFVVAVGVLLLVASGVLLSAMPNGARPEAPDAMAAPTVFGIATARIQATFPASSFVPSATLVIESSDTASPRPTTRPAVAPAPSETPVPQSSPAATALIEVVPPSGAVGTPVVRWPSSGMAGPVVIGESVQKRPITYFKFGNGPVKRLLVGGIHGGYEFNTVKLMSRTIEYFRDNPSEIPPQVTLYVIADMNPDGSVAGTDRINGRLNANKVDLNRNWDYQWLPDAFHGKNQVSGGRKPFSEPESESVRAFIEDNQMDAVIFYHSAFNAVFQGAVVSTTKTLALAKLMARVTGYRHLPNGVPGQFTTGDAIDYLTAKANITAIEIELLNKQDTDWDRNLPGIQTFLKWDLVGRSPAELQPVLPVILESPVNVPISPMQRKCQRSYTILEGEVLSTIAEKCGVDMVSLLQANPALEQNPNQVVAGQIILIP